MDPQLESYKKNNVDKLVLEFNYSVTSLRSQLLTDIDNINNSKLHIRIKNNNILFLNRKYNSTIAQLKQNLIIKINKVNRLTSFPERKTSDKFAVLVGINYKNKPNELYGCINDTKNIQNILQTKYGFKNFVFLTDDTNIKPTKENIIHSLTQLLVNAISGDSLFFLYSGHGTYTTDLNNDELDGQDELIIPIYATNINACILDDELNQIIKNNLKPGVKLFALFDSCFSGTILDLKYSLDKLDNVTVNPNIVETLGQVFMISGCTDKQTSADAFINNQNTGAMIFSFIEAIEQYGTSITLKQLVEYMRRILIDNDFKQIPQLSSGKSVDFNIQKILF